MQRKLNSDKESEFSLPEEHKESIQERLRSLWRGRSLRKVSLDWGLPYSTINNYYTKGTMPGVDVLKTVAEIERVSISWLINGEPEASTSKPEVSKSVLSTPSETEVKDLRSAWNLAFDFMDKKEVESLLRILFSSGARGLIRLAEQDSNKSEEWQRLSPALQQRALELVSAYVEAREGAPADCDIDSTTSQPASTHKRAG